MTEPAAASASVGERLSRLTVLISVCVALVAEAWLGAREWRALLPITVLVFAIVFVIARRSPAAAWGVVLAVAYVRPLIFLVTLGRSLMAYEVVWLAGLFAVVVARPAGMRWAFPGPWKLPLAYWALVIALAWPIVVWREADFSWSMLSYYHIGNSGLGGPPPVGAVMVLNVSLSQLLGLLCFDRFFRDPEFAGPRFRRAVLWPLAASLLVGCGVAVYQGLVDLSWLSGHQWPAVQRAAGGLLDGSAFGTLAGAWSSALVPLVGAGPGGVIAGGLAVVLAWGGLWATGSRMALLAGAISAAFLLGAGLRARQWRRGLLFAVGIAGVGTGPVSLGVIHWGTLSPVRRSLQSLPAPTVGAVAKFAKDQLFDRTAPFGSASILMVEQFPVTGVGIAGFYQMFPDYSYLLTGSRAYFDNAQSWYRHQLAELGIVGSLGWLWWIGSFGWMLVTTRGVGAQRSAAGVVKGALVAIGVTSIVSMPTASAPVALTVWVFAFWYLSLSAPAQERLHTFRWSRTSSAWWIVWIVALIFAADTYWVGRTALRPPYRAIWADWNYERGFYDPEKTATAEPFRWTSDNAVSVFPATGPYLKLTVWLHHPDLESRPVDVRIWRAHQRIATMTVHDAAPMTWYIRGDPNQRQMMIETWVSRTWTPADYGERDSRTLGLAVGAWAFVQEPPRGATVIN